jgi:bifunctional DNA-binding transcriptional regulator/antitoxin component of YhaV-PrlF toxin-antitoxin module
VYERISCDKLKIMKIRKITTGGQISLPATIRSRWGTKSVAVEDLGDHVVVRPMPDDPIVAARGALEKKIGSTASLRAKARKDEVTAEERR